MDFLIALDRVLFVHLNSHWTCGFLDAVMPVLTDFHKTKFGLFFLIPGIIGVWIWRRRGSAVKSLVGLALLLGFTDIFSARVLKPLIHRARPEHANVQVIVRDGGHGRYGFPSNHALNTFAATGFLFIAEPAMAAPVAVLGAVIAYSRVYIGAHFPLDVLGGALIGFLMGLLGGYVFRTSRGWRVPWI